MKKLDEMTEGEAVSKFFLKIGKLCKDFWVWAWNLEDSMEYFAGGLIISLIAACGLAGIFLLGALFWATFNTSWLWVFSWPPAIGLTAFLLARVARGIVEVYKDFF